MAEALLAKARGDAARRISCVQSATARPPMLGNICRRVLEHVAEETGVEHRILKVADCYAGHVVASTSFHAKLPGSELIEQGLDDLAAGRETEAALLLEIAAPRLRSVGVDLHVRRDENDPPPEHRLYELLSAQPDAHSRYNALLARIASYAHAAEQHATAS